jgi:hypothetical protein
MVNEQQLDGQLIYYPAAHPIGREKLLIHVNGVTSSHANQLRDLEALVWLTIDHPFDVIGIHNSTEGFRTDILESLVGKAELFRFWPQQQNPDSQARLQGYAEMLAAISPHDLAPDTDILQEIQRIQSPQGSGSGSSKSFFDLELLRQLPSLQKMGWREFESYFYGAYPAGAPRATLRLAYELLRGIKAGSEIFVVTHSQGMIIAAIAFHILRQFFGDYDKWTETIRLIGYGPVIMFEDLPPRLRWQTVMIQHRQDLVAESLSNVRNINLWSNIQVQLKNVLDRAEELARLVNTDSHHSASYYLGIRGGKDSDRSAQLISLLLNENWETSPTIQSLRASRIVIEDALPESLASA